MRRRFGSVGAGAGGGSAASVTDTAEHTASVTDTAKHAPAAVTARTIEPAEYASFKSSNSQLPAVSEKPERWLAASLLSL